MPRQKLEEFETLTNEDIDRLLHKISGDTFVAKQRVRYKTKTGIKETVVARRYPAEMVRCLVALLWVFGKRAREILTLRKKDFVVAGDKLLVHFVVSKKKKKEKYTKMITLKNRYVPHILGWLEKIKSPDDFIFPGRAKPRTRKVKRRLAGRGGRAVVKTYCYRDTTSGHIWYEEMWAIIKSLDPKIWCHLFRHSLATMMAEYGATESELMAWFDWSTPLMAHHYVQRGTKLLEKWAQREW